MQRLIRPAVVDRVSLFVARNACMGELDRSGQRPLGRDGAAESALRPNGIAMPLSTCRISATVFRCRWKRR
jgi:hypothetical protein